MKKIISIATTVGFIYLLGVFPLTTFAKDPNPFADFDSPTRASAAKRNLYPTHPKGAVGLFRTYSALTQPASKQSFGMGFMGNYYLLTKDFPAQDFITERFDGGFFVNYTPLDFVEVFAAVGLVTTNNEAPTNPIYRQVPNLDFGLKVSRPITQKIDVGLVYHGEHRGSISGVTGSQSALNHELLAVGTVSLEQTVPMRVHVNAGYRVDNNKRVSQLGADARLVNVTEAYADNAILTAVGVEYLLQVASISLEYSMDMIGGGSFSTHPQRMSLGTHIFPTSDRAFAITLGSDIATSKADATVAGTYREPTYSFYFGLNYMFGLSGNQDQAAVISNASFLTPKSKTSTPRVESKKGSIRGYVTNIETGEAIVDASVQLCGGSLVHTDEAGLFASPDINEGPCALSITHPDFQPLQDQVTILGGVDSPFDFGLLQSKILPASKPVLKYRLTIAPKDKNGKDVAALVYFASDKERKPLALSESSENVFDLKVGPHEFFAKYNGAESQTKYILLKEGEEKYIEFSFGIAPKTVTISKDKKSIEISEKVQFEVGKALLTYNSQKLLEEIARVLRENTDIELIEIAGHTDSVGDGAFNAKLSQARSEAVMMHLFKFGVAQPRMRAVGYGEDFPIADNKTEDGKYQNRRVEFRILKRK